MWDAVHLFARALERLDESRMVEPSNLECEEQKAWEHGLSLINFMKTVSWAGLLPFTHLQTSARAGLSVIHKLVFLQTEIEGLTGSIRFDNQGFRTDYSLDIVELSPTDDSTMTIGNVDPITFNLTRIERAKEELRKELESVRNKTFRVQIAIVSARECT